MMLIKTLTLLNGKTIRQKYFITFTFDCFYVCVNNKEQWFMRKDIVKKNF